MRTLRDFAQVRSLGDLTRRQRLIVLYVVGLSGIIDDNDTELVAGTDPMIQAFERRPPTRRSVGDAWTAQSWSPDEDVHWARSRYSDR